MQVNRGSRLDLQFAHRTAGAASEAPAYEKIVLILTCLVEVSHLRAAKTGERDVRTLLNTLKTSLDAALRLE